MPWKSTGPLTISLPPTRYLELARTLETHKSVDRMVTAHHLALDQSPHTIRQRKARKRQGYRRQLVLQYLERHGECMCADIVGPVVSGHGTANALLKDMEARALVKVVRRVQRHNKPTNVYALVDRKAEKNKTGDVP